MSLSRDLALRLANAGDDGPFAVRCVRDAIDNDDQSLLTAFIKNVRHGSAVDELLATVSHARLVAAWVQVCGRTATEVIHALERTRYSRAVALAASDRTDLSDDTYRSILATGSDTAAERILNFAPAGIDVLTLAAEVRAESLKYEDVSNPGNNVLPGVLSRLPRQVAQAAWLANRPALTTWALENFALSADQLRSVTVASVIPEVDKPHEIPSKLQKLLRAFAAQPAATDDSFAELCEAADQLWKERQDARRPSHPRRRTTFLMQRRPQVTPDLPPLDVVDPWGPGEDPIAAATASGLHYLATEICGRFLVPWRYAETRFLLLSLEQRARYVAEYEDDVEFNAFLLNGVYPVASSGSGLLVAATRLLDSFASSGTPVTAAALVVLEQYPELAGRFPLRTLLGEHYRSDLALPLITAKVSEVCRTAEDLALLDSIVAKGSTWSFDGSLDDLLGIFRAVHA